MLENCLSDLTHIQNILDHETEPGFFGREFSFFAHEPALFYLPGSDRIIYSNRSFTQQFGHTVQDIASGTVNLSSLLCKEDDHKKIRSSLRESGTFPDGVYGVKSGDGEERQCEITGRHLYRDCYVISLRNTTDATAWQDLQGADRPNKELEEFAYVASHDLQEPLRKITTFIQRLQQKLGDTADEDIHLYIKRINVSAANMRNLIDSLLAFSRVDRNKEPAGPIDLSMVITEVMASLASEIETSGASVNSESLPVAEATPSQMQQLFHNVLDNAIKFRKSDIAPVINITGRDITDEERAGYGLPAGKKYCLITVSDNGIGFDPAYSEKIFQLFQRLHGKHEYPGAGMGLGICRKIVVNNGGYMSADGVPGEGSSFYIILPKHPSTDA